jgi:ubiquinone/menaquinone biosynthesis C-methylase UbiE
VDFRLAEDITLPLKDCEADVVYSISVLEHITSFEKTIDEISRIIKPNGIMILTIDLDLRGDSEISIENYTKLTNRLFRYFDYLYPEKVIHPADILDSEKGPYPFNKKLESWKLIWWQIKREFRQVFSKEISIKYYSPFYLAIQGFVMKKK